MVAELVKIPVKRKSSANKALFQALHSNLKQVIVIGRNADGDMQMFHTVMSCGAMNWELDLAKKVLLED